MADVRFRRTTDGYKLCVRQSCQVAIAKSWLKRWWNLDVDFYYQDWWYTTTLPLTIPPILSQKLDDRARR
ncbi:MAG: hypothetical protein SWJ54_15250 [Cyanobacteriota bacterium]|nr:hypothetical protein [Cyanobacteriota bacterium]